MRNIFMGVAVLSAAIEALAGLSLAVPSVARAIWGRFPEPLGGALLAPEPQAFCFRLFLAAGFLLAAVLQLMALRWFIDDREEGHTVFNIYGGFLILAGACLFFSAGAAGVAWAFVLGDVLRGVLLLTLSLVVLHSPETLSELRLPPDRAGARRGTARRSGGRSRSGERRSGERRPRGGSSRRGDRDRPRPSSGRSRGGRRSESPAARDRDGSDGGSERRRRPRRGRRPRRSEPAASGAGDVQARAASALTSSGRAGSERSRDSEPRREDSSERRERSRRSRGRRERPRGGDDRGPRRDRPRDEESRSTRRGPSRDRDERAPRRERTRDRDERSARREPARDREERSRDRSADSGPASEQTERASRSSVRPPWRSTGDESPRPSKTSGKQGGSDDDNGEGDNGVMESRVEMGRKPRRGRSSTGASFRPRPKRVRRPLWGDAGEEPRRDKKRSSEESDDSGE